MSAATIRAIKAANRRADAEAQLAAAVRAAVTEGVPVNTLARLLGVSRTRIRTLAR